MTTELKTTDEDLIGRAKADFAHAKKMMLEALASTPDERINWSPAPTARTAIHQVAHSAAALKSIREMLGGKVFGIGTSAEADKSFREWERQFTTREAVLEMFEEHSAEYSAWLEALKPEDLDTTVEGPFGTGFVALRDSLGFAPGHTNWHTAQMHYMQTICGDLDWH